MDTVRTRIAPSPTGADFHIGNAYTALINYIFAKKNGGQFIIRIEDTDRTRLVEGSEKKILQSLSWLGLAYSEGPDIGGQFAPYRQSDRLPIYKKYATELVDSGHAYYCFCTPQRLDLMRKDQEASHKPPMYDGLCRKIHLNVAKRKVKEGDKYVIRLNVPDTGTTGFHDVIRGDISFENALIDDQVLLKSDEYPTYHLGVVVDDHIMNISHVIRGEEWISSTPKHILLYQFFGWNTPIYAHMPLLRNPDKSKLSKRKNPVWVSWYREQGFLPEALLNYFALMAWSHPDGKEIFTLAEFEKVFKLENIQTSAPVFDNEKLRWLNGEYIRQKTNKEICDLIYSYSINLKPEQKNLILDIIPLIRERMKILSEFTTLAGFFFERPKTTEHSLNKKYVQLLKQSLDKVDWNHADMEKTIRGVAEKEGLKAKDLFMELRLAITGKSVGPPLLESLEILGKEESLSRLI